MFIQPVSKYVDYKISSSINNNTITTGIIDVSNKSNLKIDVNFESKDNIYKTDERYYILYTFLNNKNINFNVDGKVYNQSYKFKLDNLNHNIKINLNIPLNNIDLNNTDSHSLLFCIIPEYNDIKNSANGIVAAYSLTKGASIRVKETYKYTQYETIHNEKFPGMILNQDFNKDKVESYNIHKHIYVNRNSHLSLAFRTLDFLGASIDNIDYTLLITVNGILNQDNIYRFKAPPPKNIIYKQLQLSLDKDVNDIVA